MNEQENDQLGISIIKTIKNSEAIEVIRNIAEAGIDTLITDTLIKEEFLKDVPILNTVLSIIKTANRINDYFFLKKMVDFFQNLDKFSVLEKSREWQRIDGDNEYAKKIGEHVIFLLDKFDNLDKPALLAKIFSAFIISDLTKEEFYEISRGIEKASIDSLNSIICYYKNNEGRSNIPPSRDICEKVYFAGFSNLEINMNNYEVSLVDRIKTNSSSSKNDNILMFSFNHYAKKFATIILKRNT